MIDTRRFVDFIAQCKGCDAPTPIEVCLEPRAIGAVPNTHGFPAQLPFAAVLGCVDARAPVELLFAQGFDDPYVTRIAGNTLGPDCSGSLHYALHSFAALKPPPPEHLEKVRGAVDPDKKPLRLIVALGHSDCGAVTAAILTFPEVKKQLACVKDPLDPDKYNLEDLPDLEGKYLPDGSITGLLTRIHNPAVAVALAALPVGSLGDGPGSTTLHIAALIDLAVYLNAAWSAHQIVSLIQQYDYDHPEYAVGVRYGVLDPRDGRVRAGSESYGHRTDNAASVDVARKRFGLKQTYNRQEEMPKHHCLQEPPEDLKALRRLADEIARKIKHAAESDDAKAIRTYFNVV
jgi:hypothetical protein